MPQLTRQSSNGPVLFQLLSASSDEACVHTRTHLHHMGALLQSNLSASFTSVNPQEGRLLPEVTYRGSKARRAVIVTSAAPECQQNHSVHTATRFTKVASRNLGVSFA